MDQLLNLLLKMTEINSDTDSHTSQGNIASPSVHFQPSMVVSSALDEGNYTSFRFYKPVQ